MHRRLRVIVLVAVVVAVIPMLVYCAAISAHVRDLDMQDRGFDLKVLKTSAETRLVSNRLIDCSTNDAYRRGRFGDYIASIDEANHTNTKTDCRTCHRSGRPSVGVGDRPATPFASFTLSNYSDQPQKFHLFAGEKSEGQWKEYEIGAGKVLPFSWQYDSPRNRRSPIFWLNYEGHSYQMMPIATPNKNIGTLYYFASAAGKSNVQLLKANQPYRAGR